MEAARRIAGAEVVVMTEVGHFPMSEDRARVRRAPRPVLETGRHG